MMEERRKDGERLARLETTTDWLVLSHKDMNTKLDTIVGGITALQTARQIENEARRDRWISKRIKEVIHLILATGAGATGAAAVTGKAQAIAEQVTPHVR